MPVYIVTHSPAVAFLRRGLPADLVGDIVFREEESLSEMKGIARTLRVLQRGPVAVVFDAETTSPRLSNERLQAMREIIHYSTGSVPTLIVTAIPSLAELAAQGDEVLRASPVIQDLTRFLRDMQQPAPTNGSVHPGIWKVSDAAPAGSDLS